MSRTGRHMRLEPQTVPLSRGEQRALASFLAGRLPAGRLHDELVHHRAAALAALAGLDCADPPELQLPAAAEAPLPALGVA